MQVSAPARTAVAVIIGGGHSGLAMSKCLTDRSVNHVVLERGQVANSWKTERWDSLRLLTPNWQSRLPGFAYAGDDPDGFMTMPEVITFIEDYADEIAAPVHSGTTVTSVSPTSDGYEVITDKGTWHCKAIVLASGACNVAHVPAFADALPTHLESLTPMDYREPGQLPTGGVLVVGASATGLQLAEEIHRSGRPVTISVGEHVRMPRMYRGRDIQWWMHGSGRLDEGLDEVDDIIRARGVPSPQLVGTPERLTLDLNSLTEIGVTLRGRLGGIRDGNAQFSGGLRNQCALADLKMARLLTLFDEWATETGLDGEVDPPERYPDTVVEDAPSMTLDLGNGQIRTVLWATGFRPEYNWLNIDALDAKGRVKHDGGVTISPGAYLIGTPFLRRRKSSFIHGATDDATDLADHLNHYLDTLEAQP
jgi:putative flavoprotein involved in K+ transport